MNTLIVGGAYLLALFDPVTGTVVHTRDFQAEPPFDRPETATVGAGTERVTARVRGFEPLLSESVVLDQLERWRDGNVGVQGVLVGYRQSWLCDTTVPVVLSDQPRSLGSFAGHALTLAHRRRTARLRASHDLLATRSALDADSAAASGYRTAGTGTVLLPATPGDTITLSVEAGETAVVYTDRALPVPGLGIRAEVDVVTGGDLEVFVQQLTFAQQAAEFGQAYADGTGDEIAATAINEGTWSVAAQMAQATGAGPLYSAGEVGRYWCRVGVRIPAGAAGSAIIRPPRLLTYGADGSTVPSAQPDLLTDGSNYLFG